MKDRVPGAPGQYTASVTPEERSKLESGKPFSITLARNDQPLVEGTPYSKAAVLPDDVASALCPGMEDPTPADAFKALLSRTKAKAGFIYPLASEIVPDGFLLCDGAAYSRAEYPELYDAIKLIYTRDANGDIYDDGKTFKVPNLSKRVPVGAGDGYGLGATGGEAEHQLTVEEMPSHSHRLSAQTNKVAGSNATYLALGDGTSWSDLYDKATTPTGSSQPHNNMQPYTVVNYIIATGKGDDVGYVVAGTASGGDISVIDDTIVSTEKTWSSQKIADEISSIPSGGGGDTGNHPDIVTDFGEYTTLADYIKNGMEDKSWVVCYPTDALSDFPGRNLGFPDESGWIIEIYKSANNIVETKARWDLTFSPGQAYRWNGYYNTYVNAIIWTQVYLNTTEPLSGSIYKAVEDGIYKGCYCNNVDGEKEWLNPPMIAGTEYRTIERFHNKPVYTKYINYGKGSTGTSFSIPTGAFPVHYVSAQVRAITSSGAKFLPGNMISLPDGATDPGAGGGAIIVDTGADNSTTSFVAIIRYTKL